MFARRPRRFRWIRVATFGGAISVALVGQSPAQEVVNPQPVQPVVLTNAMSVRELSPDQADRKLPVRIEGVVTFVFNTHSWFVQDPSAGIYVGGGAEASPLAPGDIVRVEGFTGPGEYAPIVRPEKVEILGHTNLPPARRTSLEELMTGREDSQWVEVDGFVRSVVGDPGAYQILEISSGGGRLTAFVPGSIQTNLSALVDNRVRLRGACGTWFNRLRQLFGVRLMVPRAEDIIVVEPAVTSALEKAARPIGDLLRFSPYATRGHRVKVSGTVVLQQPGRALFVQDDQQGLLVQTRQEGILHPGDRVEIVGFPGKGEYNPMLQDAVWTRTGYGSVPEPVVVSPDQALAGQYDCRLVTIEGRLLDRTHNSNQLTFLLGAGDHIFSATLDRGTNEVELAALQNQSRLRLTGVCRIEVGDDWQAGPDWRAKSFRLLLRSPADVQVLALPPWWTLTKLFWAVGILTAAILVFLSWVTLLHRKVGQQTQIIRQKLDLEGTLRERYQDLFESANDMVYTHDLKGRITSINVAGERLLGLDRSGIQQRSLLDFISRDQRPAATQWLADIVDGAAPSAVEWDFESANGERLRLEISTRLIEHEGRQVEVEGIARDVSERRRLEKEILDVSTREQRRIGHDLHDGVCQQLAAISFLSDTLAGRLDEQSRPEAAEAHRITSLVNEANKQTRGAARGLFPVRLEENGLVSALQELLQNATAFFSAHCEFQCETPITVKDLAVAHHLYFIAQEAIVNAVRHGHARHILLRLAAEGEDRGVLSVSDNGCGLAAADGRSGGMGIRIMKYRARIIGGAIQIRSRPEGGVEVVCRFTLASMPAELAVVGDDVRNL